MHLPPPHNIPQFAPAPAHWQRAELIISISHSHSQSHQQFRLPSHNDNHRPFTRPRISPNRYSPYKMELCLKFLNGNCIYGDNCRFPHRVEDHQRQPLPKYDNPSSNSSRVRLCWRYSDWGECPYGERCHFIHHNSRQSSAIRVVNRGGDVGPGGDCRSEVKGGVLNAEKQVYRRPLVAKTRLCKKCEANGSCPYAHNCIFAHGESELMKFENGKALTSVTMPKQEVRGKQWVFKWTNIEKISRIYADWTENTSLVHDSSDTMSI